MSALRLFPVVVFFLVCAICSTLGAQQVSGPNGSVLGQSSPSTTVGSDPALQQAITEALLRQEVALLKDYQKDLVSSLYTTLGVIGTFVVGLFGFSGWLQIRFGKERLNSIEQSLSGRITETMTGAISGIEKEVTARIDSVSKQYDADIEKFRNTISSDAKKYQNNFNGKIWELNYSIYDLRLAVRSNPSIYVTDARNFIDYILTDPKHHEWKIHKLLGEILERLDSGTTIDRLDMTEWVAFLKKLPDDYRADREKIARHVENAK